MDESASWAVGILDLRRVGIDKSLREVFGSLEGKNDGLHLWVVSAEREVSEGAVDVNSLELEARVVGAAGARPGLDAVRVRAFGRLRVPERFPCDLRIVGSSDEGRRRNDDDDEKEKGITGSKFAEHFFFFLGWEEGNKNTLEYFIFGEKMKFAIFFI